MGVAARPVHDWDGPALRRFGALFGGVRSRYVWPRVGLTREQHASTLLLLVANKNSEHSPPCACAGRMRARADWEDARAYASPRRRCLGSPGASASASAASSSCGSGSGCGGGTHARRCRRVGRACRSQLRSSYKTGVGSPPPALSAVTSFSPWRSTTRVSSNWVRGRSCEHSTATRGGARG